VEVFSSSLLLYNAIRFLGFADFECKQLIRTQKYCNCTICCIAQLVSVADETLTGLQEQQS